MKKLVVIFALVCGPAFADDFTSPPPSPANDFEKMAVENKKNQMAQAAEQAAKPGGAVCLTGALVQAIFDNAKKQPWENVESIITGLRRASGER